MGSILPKNKSSLKSNELIDFKSVKKLAAKTDWDYIFSQAGSSGIAQLAQNRNHRSIIVQSSLIFD